MPFKLPFYLVSVTFIIATSKVTVMLFAQPLKEGLGKSDP